MFMMQDEFKLFDLQVYRNILLSLPLRRFFFLKTCKILSIFRLKKLPYRYKIIKKNV